MNESEIAWVAGVLEGEGSFFLRKCHTRLRPRISMQSTDLDVLERIAALTGMGHVRTVGQRENRKPCWWWSVDAQQDVIDLAKTLYPWMCSRRAGQIDVMLAGVVPLTRASRATG